MCVYVCACLRVVCVYGVRVYVCACVRGFACVAILDKRQTASFIFIDLNVLLILLVCVLLILFIYVLSFN